ncbi:MAG: hypothetical protein U0528_00045 [Anaerolineae bacterium]
MANSVTLNRLVFRRAIGDRSEASDSNKPLRLLILPRECLSLQIKLGQEVVRVVSGCAWISYEGKDIVLTAGDQQQFERGRFNAVITATGKQQLIIECSAATA